MIALITECYLSSDWRKYRYYVELTMGGVHVIWWIQNCQVCTPANCCMRNHSYGNQKQNSDPYLAYLYWYLTLIRGTWLYEMKCRYASSKCRSHAISQSSGFLNNRITDYCTPSLTSSYANHYACRTWWMNHNPMTSLCRHYLSKYRNDHDCTYCSTGRVESTQTSRSCSLFSKCFCSNLMNYILLTI